MEAEAGVAPKAKPAAAGAARNDFLPVIMTPFRLLMRGEPLLERGVQRLRRDALGPGNDRNDCLIGFRMLFAHRVDELPYDAAIGAHLEQAPAGCFGDQRSEEHTSELQSLMRISYAVFCLK